MATSVDSTLFILEDNSMKNNNNVSSIIHNSTSEPNNNFEDYEYDVSESLVHYDWAELVPAVIVYATVLLLGIFGNVLIIFTIARYRRLKTITNIFLASLSSADLLLVTICVPVNVAKLFSYTWTFGPFLCKFVHYMQNVSAICSVLTLTAMSIERYYAIVHPIRAQYLCTLSQARKVIVGIWVASFVLATPTCWIQVHLPVGERVPAFWCVRDWDSPLSWQLYELYMLVLVLVLPLTIMAGAYARIAREIWRVTITRSAMMNDSAMTDPAAAACAASSSAPTNNQRQHQRTSSSEPNQHQQSSSTLMVPQLETVQSSSRRSSSNNISTPSSDPLLNPDGISGSSSKDTSENGHQKGRTNNKSPTTNNTALTAHQQRLQADHRTARQVVKMLVAVVVLFTVCWSPYLIDNVLMSFELLPGARTGPVKHMRIAFHLLSYINSCCNPLVYGFMSRNFRRGFVAALKLHKAPSCCCFCCTDSNSTIPRHRGGSSRQHSIYKFSPASHSSRVVTQIRLQDSGYVRSTCVSRGATMTNCSSIGVLNNASQDSSVV